MKKNLLIIAIVVCLLSITNALATTYYVDANDGNDANDGTSWETGLGM